MYHILKNNPEVNAVIDYLSGLKDIVFSVSYQRHCNFPNVKAEKTALRHALYVLTITKNGKDYDFDFYDSIANSYKIDEGYSAALAIKLYGECLNTARKSNLQEYHVPYFQHNEEKNPIDLQKVKETTKNHQKYLLVNILGSLIRDINCPAAFSDFCDEYGYNSDSISAKSIWESVLEQNSKVTKCFNSEQIEKLQPLLENF